MKDWYKIKNGEDITEIDIFDEIGGWGISGRNFLQRVNGITAKTIVLNINSPGGSVFDGLAIYNVLKNSDKKVIVKVYGVAASIASIVALAGDEIEMLDGSMMMIHNPFIGVRGDSERLRELAEVLDKIKMQLVGIYEDSSKLGKDEIIKMMDKETWLTADEALAHGLISKVNKNVKISACFDDWTDNFQNMPQNQMEDEMDVNVLKALGVKDESSVLDAINELKKRETGLEAEITSLAGAAIEMTVELAIANKKMLPAEKDFAVKMLTIGEETFNEWIKQSGRNIPAGPQEIDEGETSEMKFEDLIDDFEKAEVLKKTDPKLYSKLKDEYFYGGK